MLALLIPGVGMGGGTEILEGRNNREGGTAVTVGGRGTPVSAGAIGGRGSSSSAGSIGSRGTISDATEIP